VTHLSYLMIMMMDAMQRRVRVWRRSLNLSSVEQGSSACLEMRRLVASFFLEATTASSNPP
jgi:hypothetical protein